MKKNITFLFSFLSAKGIIFLAPLFLADILSENDFGILEYSLAGVGMLLNSLISLGVPGAYPYFILRKKRTDIEAGFNLHPIWLFVTFSIVQICYYILNLFNVEIYMAMNISYIIAVQQYYSTILKSKEKIYKAVFLDAGIYILLICFVGGYFLKLIQPTVYYINFSILFYAILLSMYSLLEFYKCNKVNIISKYKEIIIFSFHLLISSSFLFLLTVAGRILAKYFFDYKTTGIYGFYFRLAAVVVLIYQVVSIRFFKDLYITNPKKLDKYFALFYVFTFSLSIIIYFISPLIIPYFSDYYSETYLENKILFFVLFCQMTMWIATALNSSIVDREGLAKINNLYFLGLFIISIITFYFLKEGLVLITLAFVLYTIFFFANLTQFLALKTKKIIFKKSFFVLTMIYTISCIIFFIIF